MYVDLCAEADPLVRAGLNPLGTGQSCSPRALTTRKSSAGALHRAQTRARTLSNERVLMEWGWITAARQHTLTRRGPDRVVGSVTISLMGRSL